MVEYFLRMIKIIEPQVHLLVELWIAFEIEAHYIVLVSIHS